MLTTLFERLLSMALTSLPVIAVVLTVRWLLRRTPKKYTYLLWLVVAFRLVCPVSIESPVGFIQAEETTRQIAAASETYIEPTLTYRDNGGFTPDYDVLLNRGYTPNEQGEIVTNEAGTREAWQIRDLLSLSAVVWLTGMAAMAAYLVFTTLRLRRQVAAAVRLDGNVWECDSIPTPFVLGLLRPRIYIPFRMSEAERTYILSHERYHIRHGDHWAKLLGLFILTVYWWNPAVWLCWVLFCRDMEMRCDEAVLEELGTDVKQSYSLSLLSFALDRRAPMALAFGEHDAAKRVKNVLNWKQARPALVFLASSAVILVALICGTNASSASWVKIEKKPAENGGIQFTWNLEEPIQSWAIYEDIYDNGQIINSSPIVMDGFVEDGNGVSKRREAMSLRVSVTRAANGFSSALECYWSGVGGGNWTRELPRDRYYAVGMTPREGDEATFYNKIRLSPNDSVVLYSVVLNQEEDSGVTLYHRDKGLIGSNDTVVQYRLVISTRPLDEFTIEDAASVLYRRRLSHLTEVEDVRPLTETLDLGSLGEYDLALVDLQKVNDTTPKKLVIQFRSIPEDEAALEQAMLPICTILLALVEDLQQVDFAFPAQDGKHYAFYHEINQADTWASSMGYADIKAMGKTPAGIRDLMDYLNWYEKKPETQVLFDSAQHQQPVDFTERLLVTDLWGDYALSKFYVSWQDGFGPYIFFSGTPADPNTLDAAVARRAVILMQLYPDEIECVKWNYPTKDGETAEREFYRSESGMILSLSSDSHTSAPVASAEILERLLRFVNAIDSKLYIDLSREGNSMQIEEPEIFVNALIQQEEAEGLLDSYIPWDFYVDLDSWEDESINEFGAYVYYYGLSRAQFRQFVEALSTIPEELQGVELEGNERDIANITLSGRWTRAELEKLGDKVRQRKEMEERIPWPGTLIEVMGFPAYVVTDHYGPWNQRTYYTFQGGGPLKIAETFGFGEAEDYIVDLDGDGVTELVSNVTFGGDGARRAYVYQRRENDIYLGEFSADSLPKELLPNFDHWGANAWWSEYRPDSGAFRLHYAQKGSEDMGLLETFDLSLLTFSKYSG